MFLIPTLTGIPLIGAVLIYLIHNEKIRGLIIYITAALMMVTTFFYGCHMDHRWGKNTWRYYVDTVFVDHLMQIVEILLMIFIIYMSFKYKKRWVCLLSIFQTLLVLWVEYTIPLVESTHTQVDSLALLMCVICAVIGGLIGIYSVGYMKAIMKSS